jgi:hypothetical protein
MHAPRPDSNEGQALKVSDFLDDLVRDANDHAVQAGFVNEYGLLFRLSHGVSPRRKKISPAFAWRDVVWVRPELIIAESLLSFTELN